MLRFPELLPQAVRRLPNIGETHWLKAALALNRFAERYPHWEDERLKQALERAEWDTTPQVASLIHPLVQMADGPVTPRRAQAHIGRMLFPLAYRTARSWYDQDGLEAIIRSYKERAIHEGTYLGHGWTVWCSFFEIAPHLATEEARLFALERFVEFAAKVFPGFPTDNPQWAPPVKPDPGPIDPSAVLDACLERPGFFGHHVLTLGYLQRHKQHMTEVEWRVGIAQALEMAQSEYIAPEDNVLMPASEVPETPVSDADLEGAILDLILSGPANPHSLTLADISYDLWQVANSRQRRHLVHYLRSFVPAKAHT